MARRIHTAQARRIGARLKQARIDRGLSLQELATRCEMHHSQASRIENGEFRLLAGNVQKMCLLLDVAVGENGEPSPRTEDLHVQMEKLLQATPKAAPALKTILDALRSIVEPDAAKR